MTEKAKVLDHKGYVGSIDTSLEDDVLHGKILFINDLVTYEGQTLGELRKAFVEAVDFYLDTCAENDVEPDKPCSGGFNVRIPPATHRAAQIAAARRGVSLNEFVGEAIANEVSGARMVTIHQHEHRHTHSEHGMFESEESFSYRAVTKWSNEAPKVTRH
ncbi:type II toxin-antitoxin system HicB family antitoxin [Pandoraea sp. PE-S2R-1]|uniref:type II toxin-antitoxin system HicB family antitoxin n=1 Tax=Pandoraea sp. PE-S2R-1 TaxID=1986994 RepID=UPI000B405BEB|nr:type II toxin-antitoxin system HicB family antitoxin [Pandoraea sp. PE-S2R-1]